MCHGEYIIPNLELSCQNCQKAPQRCGSHDRTLCLSANWHEVSRLCYILEKGMYDQEHSTPTNYWENHVIGSLTFHSLPHTLPSTSWELLRWKMAEILTQQHRLPPHQSHQCARPILPNLASRHQFERETNVQLVPVPMRHDKGLKAWSYLVCKGVDVW